MGGTYFDAGHFQYFIIIGGDLGIMRSSMPSLHELERHSTGAASAQLFDRAHCNYSIERLDKRPLSGARIMKWSASAHYRPWQTTRFIDNFTVVGAVSSAVAT